jgi:hypothetical protein
LSINEVEIKKKRKLEKWEYVIKELKLDVSKPVNYITAKQIKEISKEEPRLMAKIDRFEILPKIFRENNLFLVPVSRREYALVKGIGYHTLEPIIEKPFKYSTQRPFPVSALGIESESVFLDYANSCGLLKDLTSSNNLVQTVRGRRITPEFKFTVNNNEIKVNGAQVEIDAAFESPDEIFLFEAKIGIPSSFSIRQLYYPFRTLKSKKPVRIFFFCFKPEEKLYLFWEYKFESYEDYNSITLIRSKQYRIILSKSISVETYRKVNADNNKIDIPQADDVNKLIQFPFRVFEGYDTSKKMIAAFGFVVRQSSYYRHAVEILGLISEDDYRYKLTKRGEDFLKLPSGKRANFICKLLLEFPIVNEIFVDISSDHEKTITKQDIIIMLRKKSHLTGSTLERRARTIRSWFRWIRNNLGLVDVDAVGNIRINRQTRLI